MAPYRTLYDFCLHLRRAEVIPRPEGEEWGTLIQRICQPGRAAEIDEETYDWFLECLPPKYQGRGFAFAEGAEPLKYFWYIDGRCFVRQLTEGETVTFCRLAGIPLPH